MLDRYPGRPDYSDVVIWDEELDRPLTADEVAAMPQELREIYEFDIAADYEAWKDRTSNGF